MTLDETQIKELFEQAFFELLQERKDLLYELVAEIIEDFALVEVTREGEGAEPVRREEVVRILGGS